MIPSPGDDAQPVPVGTTVSTVLPKDGSEYTVIHRRWTQAGAEACMLCDVCSASPETKRLGDEAEPTGSMVCVFAVEGHIDVVDAAMFEPRAFA